MTAEVAARTRQTTRASFLAHSTSPLGIQEDPLWRSRFAVRPRDDPCLSWRATNTSLTLIVPQLNPHGVSLFFLPRYAVPSLHNSALEAIPRHRSYSDLITFVRNHLSHACQIPGLSDFEPARKPKPVSCTIPIPAMAYIAPFRALRYDPARVDLTQVVTQPYDKITPEMQNRYYDADPHNLVRIILGKPQPNDHGEENIYTRAAASFRDWRRQALLVQDPEQSLYQYVQRFQPPGGGAELERRGFIGLGKIEDYSAGIVYRHEQTLAKPKADRLELLRTTRAHFGQLLMLYSDPSGEVDRALSSSSGTDMDNGI